MARFLLLLLLPLLSRTGELNCTAQATYSSSVRLGKGEVVGGLEVIKMVEDVINNLPLTKFLQDQKKEINEIIDKMVEEAKTYKAALDQAYFDFLDRLEEHLNASEQVATRLLELAVESWINCGVNAEDILDFGYSKTAQKNFADFLDRAIADSKDITERLESIKTELDKLRVESEAQQKIIKQYFEEEIARLERDKEDEKKLFWICLIPIACPFVAISYADAISQANECIAYMNDVSADCLSNFASAQEVTEGAICLMQDWIPQSHALTTALEQTAQDNDNLLEVLEDAYIEEHPEDAGRYNTYLVRLFESMQGLQKTCENIDGFDMGVIEDMGKVKPVPDYPDQPKVCACIEIKNLDDWMKSKMCLDGHNEAIFDEDLKAQGYPRCFLDEAECREEVNEFLPNICTPKPSEASEDKTEL